MLNVKSIKNRTQPCPQVLQEQAERHQAILHNLQAPENEYLVNAFPHGIEGDIEI